MPDDCLIDICRHVPLEDLSSVALTCTRLHDITRQTFSFKPKNKYVDVNLLARSFGLNSMEKLEWFFQVFGDLLLGITLDLTDFKYKPIDEMTSMNEPTLKLISKYCSDGALEKLRLSGVTLRSPTSPSGETLRLFGRLKKIRLDFCVGFSELLSVSKECEDLQIFGSKWNDDVNFNLRFPKLKTFALRYKSISSQEFNVNCADFLRNHTNLKILKLHASPKTDFNLNVIAGLKELEVLKLVESDSPIGIPLQPLCNLMNLKTLVVESRLTDATSFLQRSLATTLLEYLALDCPVLNFDFFVGLSKLTCLRSLKLTRVHGISTEHLQQLNLVELTDLILEYTFVLTVDDLLVMIERCPKLQSITLAFTGHINLLTGF